MAVPQREVAITIPFFYRKASHAQDRDVSSYKECVDAGLTPLAGLNNDIEYSGYPLSYLDKVRIG